MLHSLVRNLDLKTDTKSKSVKVFSLFLSLNIIFFSLHIQIWALEFPCLSNFLAFLYLFVQRIIICHMITSPNHNNNKLLHFFLYHSLKQWQNFSLCLLFFQLPTYLFDYRRAFDFLNSRICVMTLWESCTGKHENGKWKLKMNVHIIPKLNYQQKLLLLSIFKALPETVQVQSVADDWLKFRVSS